MEATAATADTASTACSRRKAMGDSGFKGRPFNGSLPASVSIPYGLWALGILLLLQGKRGILLIGDGLAPLVRAGGARSLEGHVAHPAVGGSAVPQLHLCVPSFAIGDEQDLAAAVFRMVDVPVIAAARLEGDVGDELGLRGVGQRV